MLDVHPELEETHRPLPGWPCRTRAAPGSGEGSHAVGRGERAAPTAPQDSEVMLERPPGGAMIFCAVRRAMWSSACEPGGEERHGGCCRHQGGVPLL